MNKTEEQMFDNEEWTANLKFCVGDLSIPQWTGVLTLIQQKIRASNARTRLAVLEEVEGEMPEEKKPFKPMNIEWGLDAEEEGFNACLSQIKEIINELKLK